MSTTSNSYFSFSELWAVGGAARMRLGARLVSPPRRMQLRGAARAQGAPPPVSDSSQDESAPPRVIGPEVARRKIKVPRIHSSNVEVGLNYGVLSIEDFG